MTDHGLPFTGHSVLAIQRGMKTQTRRLLSSANCSFGSAPRSFWQHAALERAWVDGRGTGAEYLHCPCHRGDAAELDRLEALWAAKGQTHSYREMFPDCSPCAECERMGWPMTSHRLWPRIKKGDRIWAREAWAPVDLLQEGVEREEPTIVAYKADGIVLQWGADFPGGLARPTKVEPSRRLSDVETGEFDGREISWRSPPLHAEVGGAAVVGGRGRYGCSGCRRSARRMSRRRVWYIGRSTTGPA